MIILQGILVGSGLSVAAGFRVSIPLLVASWAARSGHLKLAPGFHWLASDAAVIAFAVATVVEIGGYFIPFVDDLLDALATPAAVVAGMMLTASSAINVPPWLRFALAILAGGGAAALFQAFAASARQVSTLATGGLAKPLLAAVEAACATLIAALAVTLPVAALAVACGLGYFAVTRLVFRRPATRAA